jgi:hypothetical protein
MYPINKNKHSKQPKMIEVINTNNGTKGFVPKAILAKLMYGINFSFLLLTQEGEEIEVECNEQNIWEAVK